MNGSAIDATSGESAGLPAIRASAAAAASRALVAALVGREIEVPEIHVRGQREAVGISEEPLLEFGIARLVHCRQVRGKEIHLLGEPPLDDLVVAIKTEGDRLTEQNLLGDLLIHEAAQLVRRRLRPALREPGHCKLADVVLGQFDFLRVDCCLRIVVGNVVDAEKNRADDEEVEEWLAQQPSPFPCARCGPSSAVRRFSGAIGNSFIGTPIPVDRWMAATPPARPSQGFA